jgi:predicted Zn-dependent peptidase
LRRRISIEVKKFFDPYDAPNNAVLAMVGDLETAEARKWVENYFGGIKSSQPAAAGPDGATVKKKKKR